ncbi:HD domain-containing protein [Halodesulfovibrio sp.]|jgi:tRNA nucleotidyltransferase (CCA-adding enzyme)|uniref:HD domain-containing protein n=1 Tax=Halodesulfovibrio sp. TaxID=1912772 RepID=UPI0025D785E9|nr:HD domain-containing protein [Halodesulfovibrio sp.]MCT4627834.1 HD domain-containing protein [Halodesulfovibrio sp.]
MTFYLVGGAVRDMLLGIPPKEYDFAFSGTVDNFISCNPSARKAGNDFGICILNGIEYAPLRGGSIDEDLTFRDLTINALALDEDSRIYSLPSTLHDLQNKILKPASETAFLQDPVRVFRVARFAAALPEFSIHPDTITQMQRVAASGMLDNLTPERVGTELLKALRCSEPGRFFTVLNDAGCLNPWFAELSRMSDIPAGPVQYHSADCLTHIVTTINKCPNDIVTRYMALCHDLGKQETKPEILPQHIGHEKRGVQLAENLGQRLKLSNNLVRAGAVAALQHMKGGQYLSLRSGTKVDLLYSLHRQQILENFFMLVEADSGKNYLEQAKADLEVILSVELPAKDQNLGAESGKRLRELRCIALSETLRGMKS